MKSALLSLGLIALAPFAAAEQIFLDDPESCHVLETEDGMIDFAAGGGLILSESGYNSLEYFCSFQPDLQYHWDGYQVTTHTGHCELPGPQYFPQLFTVVMDEEEPGIVTIWDGEPEPQRFYSCTG